MDRRLVGTWYKEEMGETLNIFDETPPRMKMSFSSSGHYHFEPNCVYEKDEYLCFEINDEQYRMVYHVQFVEDHLEGYYTQHGKDTQIRYTLVSAQPEDKPYEYLPMECFIPGTQEKRIDILRKYAAYGRSRGESYESEYVLGGELPAVLEKYGFSEYVKNSAAGTDEVVFKILDFVCDNFGHGGSVGLPPNSRKITDMIAFCESHDGQTNCRGLSLLLASLLRLYSVKARHITCMPYEDPFDDCHVVVDCLLPSGKRIMLDPSWRLFFKDAEGEYVSLERLRNILIADEPLFANADASHNEEGFDEEYYRNYMTKNTFRFSRGTLFADGLDERAARRVELVPADYPVEKLNSSDHPAAEFVYDDTVFWRM